MEDWEKYVKEVVGGVESEERRREEEREEDGGGEISKEELDRMIRKLKDGKLAGGDDIVNGNMGLEK